MVQKILTPEQQAYYKKLVNQGADPDLATKAARKYSTSANNREWLMYLGLILAVIGGLVAAFYSIIAIFLVFEPINNFGFQGELNWRLIGIIVGGYAILGTGVFLGKKGRRQ